MISIDAALNIVDETCGEDCSVFIQKWGLWCKDHHRTQLALIDVTDPNKYFTETLDAKSRNMVRKCERQGFTFESFNYNSYLNQIYKINTSREIRQGKPMSESYKTPPRPISRRERLCNIHQHIWIGGFKENELLAYCSLIVLNEIAIINTILGHDKALTYGIMNGLIQSLVWTSYRTGAKYLNYLDLINCTDSMHKFKTSVGFEPHVVHFV